MTDLRDVERDVFCDDDQVGAVMKGICFRCSSNGDLFIVAMKRQFGITSFFEIATRLARNSSAFGARIA